MMRDERIVLRVLAMVLLLANHHDPIRHCHIELVLVIPGVRIAIGVRRMVRPDVLLLIVLPCTFDSFRDAHLLAYVLCCLKRTVHG